MIQNQIIYFEQYFSLCIWFTWCKKLRLSNLENKFLRYFCLEWRISGLLAITVFSFLKNVYDVLLWFHQTNTFFASILVIQTLNEKKKKFALL